MDERQRDEGENEREGRHGAMGCKPSKIERGFSFSFSGVSVSVSELLQSLLKGHFRYFAVI